MCGFASQPSRDRKNRALVRAGRIWPSSQTRAKNVIEDREYSSIRPLVDWLDYNGFTVVTKAGKEFVDSTGRRKMKGNMDIELAVDTLELAGGAPR